MTWAAVILAAGEGTRMKSKRPKVLHEVCGRPMVGHVAAAARQAGVDNIAAVVGFGADAVRKALDGATFVHQPEPLGTGHAVDQARAALEGKADHVLVLNGDVPLVHPETLRRLMAHHVERGAPLTFLTSSAGPVDGLARVIRGRSGAVQALVEDDELTADQRSIPEINVGVYSFNAQWLWSHLGEVTPAKRGEIFLTSLIGMAHAMGTPAETIGVAEPDEALGVDTRQRLAQAEAVVRRRVRERWMSEGVTLIDPDTIYIDADAQLARDVVVQPNTSILGASVIGEDSEIGPGSIISSSTIGQRCRVQGSLIEDSILEADVAVGPYSHLRGNTYVESGTELGNFVEIKKSRVGANSKAHHFTYLGDATLGKNVNIGAGTITCNFDGVNKNPTVIEEDAFVGCDTMLVAPITIGARSNTGAGAVVTKDVPPDSKAIGMPARSISKKPPEPQESNRQGRT